MCIRDSNWTANNNCSFGNQSLFTNSTGNNNCAVGYNSGYHLNNSSNNTFLGYQTDVSGSISITQSTALGANAIIDASNQIVLGTSTESIKIPGSYVGIGGHYNPGNGYALDVNGNSNFTGQISAPAGITGTTGSFTNLSASQQILAPGGITGATGYFTSLSVSGNTTFSSLPTCNETPSQDSQLITKGFADATYTTSENIVSSNNTWLGFNTFNKTIFGPSGITGATGSFTNLQTSNDANINTITVGLLSLIHI